MEYKVFKMNDYDTVVSPLSMEDTNEWYKNEFGQSDDEQPVSEVKEVNINDGFWDELSLSDAIEELEQGKEVRLKKFGGSLFEYVTFKDYIEDLKTKKHDKPIVACSTEW